MAEISMRQIEAFLVAAKHQNISQAASELYVSQPSLSKSISKLEKEVGTVLFQRTNHGVVLTEEGEELYARIEFEFHRFRVNVEEICSWNRRRENKLIRIGCLNRQIAFEMAREQAHAYCLRYPDIDISLERFDAHSLRSKLLSEELDLIVTLDSELVPRSEFESLHLCEYALFFIVPMAWAQKGLSELSGKTLIIESPTQRRTAEEVCRAYGIVPDDVSYVSSYSMLTTRIGREDGFSVDGKMFDTPLITHRLSYLPIKRFFAGNVVLAWRRGKNSAEVSDFAEFLRPKSKG